MYIGIIIICISGLIIAVGIMMVNIFGNAEKSLKGTMNKTLQKNLGYDKEGKLFEKTHYNISLYSYNKGRLIISLIVVGIGIITVNNTIVMLGILGYIALYPRKCVLNKITLPFGLIYKLFLKRDKEMKNDELLEILSLLKNMMVQLRSTPKGTDYIVDYLAGTTELTKPAFLKFLNLIRLGKSELAEKTFIEEIDTPLAADTARILVQLDKVEPIALEQNLISIQNEIREIGNTQKQTKHELYSDLILIPIISTIMLVFLNFMLVTYIGEIVKLNYIFNM